MQRGFTGVFIGGATLAMAYVALNPPDVAAVPGGEPRGRPAASSGWSRCSSWTRCSRCSWPPRRSCSSAATTTSSARPGLTYADYVHQGFGQLTVATLLMLTVVWAASRRVGPDAADRLWMRVSLGLLCALTLVVVVSALHRMQLYQEAYGFTQARLVVDVFEGWLGVVVLAVALAGVVSWGAWVARFALVTGVVGLLGIAAINPDAWIAQRNIDRYEQTGKLDTVFLSRMSDDALPLLSRLPEPFPQRGAGPPEPAGRRRAGVEPRPLAGRPLPRRR